MSEPWLDPSTQYIDHFCSFDVLFYDDCQIPYSNHLIVGRYRDIFDVNYRGIEHLN